MKRGLLQSDIERAIIHSHSNKEAARYLQVSYTTYKKYAKQYFDKEGVNLFDKNLNQAGKGIRKILFRVDRTDTSLEEVLNNKVPNFSLQKLKIKLLNRGICRLECELCGFSDVRITDGMGPYLLSFKEQPNDYRLENLQMLCYNCYFLTVGNLMGINKEYKIPNK